MNYAVYLWLELQASSEHCKTQGRSQFFRGQGLGSQHLSKPGFFYQIYGKKEFLVVSYFVAEPYFVEVEQQPR